MTRELLTLCDRSLVVVHPDANSHIRLHQQPLPANGDILINDLRVGSQLQEDLYQLWLESQPRILPVTIHRDEAMAECWRRNNLSGVSSGFAGGGRGADHGELVPDPLFRRESGMIRLSTLLLAPPVGSGCVRAMMTIGSTALRGCRRRLAVCGRRWSGR